MKTLLILISIISSSFVFAQDMSKSEKNGYKDNPDGSSTYIGHCTTHEDYLNKYYAVTSTEQKYIETSDLNSEAITKIIENVGKDRIVEALRIYELDQLGSTQETLEEIIKNYVDDITVETITHKLHPELKLLRFNVGYGGGNGGYLILQENETASKKYH